MKTRIVYAIVLGLAVSAVLLAQGIDGKFTGQIPGGRRGPQDVTLTLKASGTTLNGTLTTGQGEQKLEEGKFEGGNVSFKTKQTFNDNTITFSYTGKLNGDDLTLTRTAEGGGGGGRGGRGGPAEFTLKRTK
jgi:hypothetical protein